MKNIMQISQGLERDMRQNSSRETRPQKVSSSLVSKPAHREQNMKTSRIAMSHQFSEIFQHCQATKFVNFLTRDESRFFFLYPHDGMVYGPRPEMMHWKCP
jgi:hypothetical protein